MSKKIIAVAAAIAIVAIATVGGTLAWFTSTAEATNVFTVGNVNIELFETDRGTYPIVPGGTLLKDPTIRVKAGSADCYLLVYIDNKVRFNNTVYAFPDIIPPTEGELPKAGWMPVTGLDGIDSTWNLDGLYMYSMIVEGPTEDTDISVFETVTFDSEITNSILEQLKDSKIDVSAFAIQADNIGLLDAVKEAAKAFKLVPDNADESQS